MIVQTVPISRIEVRERTRKEISGIDSLAASIEARGLLQPIVLRRDGMTLVLVAGGRRIAALKKLDRAEVDAHIVETLNDELEALLAEGEENTERQPFTPSEAVAHAARIEAVESARALERKAQAGRKSAPGRPSERGANLAPLFSGAVESVHAPAGVPPSATESKTRTRVANAVGMKPTTLAKAKHIVEMAEDVKAPAIVRETALEARREMDRTGHVDGYHRRVKAAEEVAEQQAKVEAGTAVAEYLNDGQAFEDASYRHEFLQAITKANGFLRFDPSRIAEIGDEKCMTVLAMVRKQIDEFHNKVEERRPKGLRVINGG